MKPPALIATPLLIFVLSSIFPSQAHAQENVALIVDSAIESYSGLSTQSLIDERIAEEHLYKKAGYHTIELRWGMGTAYEPTAENMRTWISTLRGVKHFTLSFIGHGDIVNVGVSPASSVAPLEPKRFIPFQPSPNETFDRGSIDPSLPVQFFILDDDMRPKSFIGIEDIKNSIEILKSFNKGVEATVNVSNCYGGNVPRELADLSQVQSFSATSRNLEAVPASDFENRLIDFNVFFDRALETGMTFNQAFSAAQHEVIEGNFMQTAMDPNGGGYPRNQMEEMLQKFCATKRSQNRDSSLDAAKQQALAAALAAPIAALNQLNAILSQPACQASQSDFVTALDAVAKRTQNLIQQTNQGWRLALDRLIDKDLEKIINSDQFKFYRTATPRSLYDLKRVLEKLGRIDGSGVGWLLIQYARVPAQDLKAAQSHCGFIEGSLPGVVNVMTPSRAKYLGLKAISCLENSKFDPLTKNILANEILEFVNDSQGVPANCRHIRKLEEVYWADLSCADQFRANASEADWQRLIELNSMGNETVVPNSFF